VIGAAAEFTLNGPALDRDQIGAATQAKALLEKAVAAVKTNGPRRGFEHREL
jgi:hypothetical protein